MRIESTTISFFILGGVFGEIDKSRRLDDM